MLSLQATRGVNRPPCVIYMKGKIMENLTPTQRFAALKLGRPLSDYVAEKRTSVPRWSWAQIADQLADDTDGDIVVSREALRQWYGQAAA